MKRETWRIIETGFQDAYFNMAVDEVLLTQKEKGMIPSTIRFYGWRPGALSLGYTQKIASEINLEALRNLGLDCVSRITGGGIIFHHQEVTYSLTIGPDSCLFSNSVGESFRRLCAGIIKAMELLGVKADFAGDNSLPVNNSDAFCFAANSSYDIIIKQRKLGGNAQRRKKTVIFQHGSIPLELNYERILPALKNFSGKCIKAGSLNSILNKSLTFEETLGFLKRGFKEGLKIKLKPGKLSRKEIKIAQAIAQEKRDKFRSLILDPSQENIQHH